MAAKRAIEPKSLDGTMDLSEAGTKLGSPSLRDEQAEGITEGELSSSEMNGTGSPATEHEYRNGLYTANETSMVDSCGTTDLIEELQKEHVKR
jgi:hypothetical protein